MAIRFNPLIFAGFDYSGGGSSSISIGQVISGGQPNRILETDSSGALSQSAALLNGQFIIGSTGSSPVVASLTGTANQLLVTNSPGSINLSLPQNIALTSSPTFAGLTLTGFSGVLKATAGVISAGQISLISDVTGILPIANGGTNLGSIGSSNQILSVATAGAVLEYRTISTGTSGNDFNVAFGTGTTTFNLPDASDTARGVVNTTSQTFLGTKTFSGLINTDGGIDISTSGTLGIGTSANATVINIGNAGATINMIGTVVNEHVTQLNVSNPTININTNGGVGSAASSGLQVEENSIFTGYVLTSSDRNSWLLKAPNTAGIATITAGSVGILLNQSSHNPVTINVTANGLSVDGSQALTLGLSSAGSTGALSSTDWSTFNSKQSAGNYITALSGDVVATGPGSAVSTIQPGVVTNAKIAAAAGISVNKLQALTVSSPVRTDGSGFLSVGDINLASTDVSGVLPVINGGTNSTTALNNNRIIVSSGGSIVEAPALSDGQILIGYTGQAPVGTTITAGTGVNIVNAHGSITISVPTTDTGDIPETLYTSTTDTPTNESITGLAFANASIRAFKAQITVLINATTNLYAFYELNAIQNTTGWYLTQSYTGDESSVVFSVTSAGQVQYSKTVSSSGYTSTPIKFRAQVITV